MVWFPHKPPLCVASIVDSHQNWKRGHGRTWRQRDVIRRGRRRLRADRSADTGRWTPSRRRACVATGAGHLARGGRASAQSRTRAAGPWSWSWARRSAGGTWRSGRRRAWPGWTAPSRRRWRTSTTEIRRLDSGSARDHRHSTPHLNHQQPTVSTYNT